MQTRGQDSVHIAHFSVQWRYLSSVVEAACAFCSRNGVERGMQAVAHVANIHVIRIVYTHTT